MSHYKPYPAYKDSGVEWIGKVPAEWERRKLSHSFAQIGSGTTPPTGQHEWYSDSGIPWVTTGELRENVITETTKYVTPDALEEFSALRIYPVGALAIAMYGATIGRLGILGVQAATNQACCVLAGEIFLSVRFAYYWLLASKQPIIDLYAVGGGQPNINQEIIASLRAPAPGIEEQREITNHLDRETARIDALIAKKTEFIDLLGKKRQALITHAVTKGLDPNVKMKDSGVEWIGEVPEHWTISKLKYVSRALIGLTYAPEDVVTDGSGITVLRSSNIQNGQLDLADIVQVRKVVGSELMAQVGDILICSRNGSRALIGKNIQLDERSLGCTFGAFMTVVRGNFNGYLYFVFNSTMFDANSALYMTSTVNQLTISMIANMEVPFPPEVEQKAIVSQLRNQLLALDTLLSKTQLSIDLLKKRRSALITAAITGQIDLREGHEAA